MSDHFVSEAVYLTDPDGLGIEVYADKPRGAWRDLGDNITRQLTLMYGVRYDSQTNLPDHNNFSPRTSVAYGAGRGLVFRGGWGMFYERMGINRVAEQRRYDGIRQYEIVIDKPLYPDPFSGALRNTFPSIRVTDPNIHTPVTLVAMAWGIFWMASSVMAEASTST